MVSECLILNDASLPFDSVEDCEQNLDVFFSIVHRASISGVGFYRADDLAGSWNSLIYANGFELGGWINNALNIDKIRLIKSVIGKVKCPLIAIENPDHEHAIKNMLFMLSSNKNIEVKALGVASVINSPSISFSSHANWMVDPIAIVQEWYEDGESKIRSIDVKNICSLAHIDNVLTGIEAKRKANRSYLRSLSIDNNEDFEHLIFCGSALKDLSSPSVSVADFPNIIEVLSKLNDAISNSNCLDDLVAYSELTITGESTKTMENKKYARRREFKHPTLGVVSFEEHVKNFPGAKRMHILPDYENNSICIGYFGRHLPTDTDPT